MAALVQAVALPVNGTYPASTSFASPITVGNYIRVVFLHTYAGCVPSCSDNLGNVYTFRGTQLQNGTGHYLEVFEAPVTVGGACTVSPAAGCGGLRLGAIVEASGLEPIAYDGENDVRNTASPIGCGGVVTTQPGDLLIGLFVPSNSGTVPTFTMTDGSVDLVLPGGSRGEKIVYRFAGAAGATDITATVTGPVLATDPIDGYMAAFMAVPVVVPVIPTQGSVGTGPRIPFAKRHRLAITERDILRTRKRATAVAARVIAEDPRPVVLVEGVPLAVPVETERAPVAFPVGESATVSLQPKPYTKPQTFDAPDPWRPSEPEPHWLTDDEMDALIYALA